MLTDAGGCPSLQAMALLPDVPDLKLSDADLIKIAVEWSGKSARRFATEELLRDERTLRRWLAGDATLPEVVRRQLVLWLVTPPTHWTAVGTLPSVAEAPPTP